MADAFEPQLSSPGSQARTVAPIVTQAQPSALQQVVGAIPDIANVAIRANQVSQKKEAAAQQAADEEALGQAIVARNEQLNLRDEALALQTDVFNMTADVEKARADGIITADEEQVIKTFQSKFNKLKSAESQNLLDSNRFNIQSRTLLNQAIAKNPRIGKELLSVWNQGTGGNASPTTGSAQAQQIQFNQTMSAKYGTGWTRENALKEASMQRQLMDVKNQQTLGSVTVDNIAAGTSISVSASIDEVMTPITTAFKNQQALTQDQIDAGLAALSQREDAVLNSIRTDVFKAQKDGRIIDDAEIRTIEASVRQQFEVERKWMTDRDLQAMLGKRNQTEQSLWIAGLGGKIQRFKEVSATMGQGGMTAMQAMLAASSDSDRKAIVSLTGSEITGGGLANFKSNVVDAMTRISQDQPVPGFEKLDAFIGLKAMKSGDVGEPVKQNTLTNISNLVDTPQDASDALKSLNDPKVSRQFSTSDKSTVATLVNNVNNYESLIFSEIQATPGAFVEFKAEQFKPGTGKFGRATPSSTSASALVVKTPMSGGRTGSVVNADLTRKLNTAMEIHKNPNYSSVLQPTLPWIKEVVGMFSEQPQVEEPAVQP